MISHDENSYVFGIMNKSYSIFRNNPINDMSCIGYGNGCLLK